MKRIVLIVFLLLYPSILLAGVIIEMKSGATLEWEDYTEETNQYCTFKYGGQICVSKNDVVSFKQDRRGIDIVIQPTVSSSSTSEHQALMDNEKKRLLEEINAEIDKLKAESENKRAKCKKEHSDGSSLGKAIANNMAMNRCISELNKMDDRLKSLERNRIRLLTADSSSTDNQEVIDKLDSIEKRQKQIQRNQAIMKQQQIINENNRAFEKIRNTSEQQQRDRKIDNIERTLNGR